MSGFHDNVLLGASGSQGYQISRSVRLRSSASAYFNRTPASAGNRKTWTWSGWVKRGTLPSSGYYSFLGADSGGGQSFYIAFDNSTQQLELGQGATVYRKTTQVFRDPSAWYHLVINSDTTQATASNRLKIYVNGVQVTAFATSNDPSLNGDWALNNNVATSIGADIPSTGARNYFDGYMTEVNFIDGQALTPASFGETNAVTGVWQPKKYTGTYGTNGFYLNFSDNSAATAAAIGKDYSGNGNNWTPNNISVTAGATYDSMLDVPTQWADGGNGRGNYATLNPLSTLYTVTNGNLDFTYTNSTSGVWYLKDTLAVSYGKYYWEVTPTNVGAGVNISIGIILDTNTQTNTTTINLVTDGYVYHSDGNKYSGSTAAAYGATYTNNDVIGVALDLTAGTLVFYKNNVSQGTAFTGLTSSYMLLVCCHLGGTSRTVAGSVNAGQRPFAYTPPSGFKALNTLNLPTPTILKGNQYFDATTYNGNGSTQSIVNSGGMQPDLVWIKARNATANHAIFDSSRGTGKVIQSNTTAAEATDNTTLTAFDSSGFSLGAAAGSYVVNTNTYTFVGWQWKEGATQGFDIVTASLSGTSPVTVSHSLGVAPKLIIGKVRDVASTNWYVYSASMAASDYLILNSTAAKATSSNIWDAAPTSTVFTVGNPQNGWAGGNSGSKLYVFYLFAEVAGFSKFGSYTGNGSADGPFVFCGFRPRFVLVKASSAAENWLTLDSATGAYNVISNTLLPNSSGAEVTGTDRVDFLSNGFKLKATGGASPNGSGVTYIYAAFAENPFKNALAR